MSKKGTPWTIEEEVDLLEGLKKGQSFEVLSKIHQRSMKAVQWRWGMYCKKMIRQGKSKEDIAQEFRVEPNFLNQILMEMGQDKAEHVVPPSSNQSGHNFNQISKELDEIKQKLDQNTRWLKKCYSLQEKLLSKYSVSKRDEKRKDH